MSPGAVTWGLVNAAFLQGFASSSQLTGNSLLLLALCLFGGILSGRRLLQRDGQVQVIFFGLGTLTEALESAFRQGCLIVLGMQNPARKRARDQKKNA